jgi:energy-coupling factor transport system substrate-specific component
LSTQNKSTTRQKQLNQVRELVLFALLGALMYCSKLIMEALPNIHLLGMLTMVYTLVFRFKALKPIYAYVFLNGLFSGFSMWWIPYLYIWTILWGITMLLPKKLPKKLAYVIYPLLCGIHGFAFGILYAPAQAFMYGFTFEQTLAWVAAGLPFDLLHGFGNLVAGLMIVPLADLMKKMIKRQYHNSLDV